ncbi:hypothetical protein V6Z11_D01G252100 [Gossypium hirsutum]
MMCCNIRLRGRVSIRAISKLLRASIRRVNAIVKTKSINHSWFIECHPSLYSTTKYLETKLRIISKILATKFKP